MEDFIASKKRILYGGIAINENLPVKARFYDFNKVLPDYDFFSPDAEEDAQELLRILERAGLPDPALRPGMHEGTWKVYVDYTAVADCTQILPWLYKKLLKRAKVAHGIHYADANFLRMQMYLELSHPRGEVERWEKVYKRLLLLNKFAGYTCKKKTTTRKNTIGNSYYGTCMDYMVGNDVIYAGSNLATLYQKPSRRLTSVLKKNNVPCIAYVTDPKFHARSLMKLLEQHRAGNFKLVAWAPQGELTPQITGIMCRDRLIAVFVELNGCISFNLVRYEQKDLKVASLDSLIYLYFVLSYVGGIETLISDSFLCAAEELIHISAQTRDSGNEGVYPAFATSCLGHQMQKSSLIRAKVERGKLKNPYKKGTRKIYK